MILNSPLRYPGGKNRLARFVASVCEKNGMEGHYMEPYAGGPSVALYLLLNRYVREIIINDLDRSVYAFWFFCSPPYQKAVQPHQRCPGNS